MKQLARKQTALALVPAAESQEPAGSQSLNDFFDGWLNTVGPAVSTSQPPPARMGFGKTPLTTTDVMRVNRATVRESVDHRHWPPEVVQTFMRADVIKRKH